MLLYSPFVPPTPPDQGGVLSANSKNRHSPRAASKRAPDANPKEIITHHAAGVAGSGNASYIDAVIMRDLDNAAWNAAAQSGTGANAWAIEYSEFVLQNWRADVVRTVSAGGAMGAQIRYTAYGEPASFSIYDIAGGGSGLNAPDGNLDGEDYSAFLNAFGAEDALADMVGADGNAPGDGSVDGNDFAAFMNAYGAGAGLVGPGVLSSEGDAGLRRGYAGYEFDPVLGLAGASVYHVRNRVYDAENGRWTKRDPLGYVDGPSMYEYCRGMAMEGRDAEGLAEIGCGGDLTVNPITSPPATVPVPSTPSTPVRPVPVVIPPQFGDPSTIADGVRLRCLSICADTDLGPLGAIFCVDGKQYICICPANIKLRFPMGDAVFHMQYRSCVEAHERQNWGHHICDPNSPNGTPISNPAHRGKAACNEAEAYRREAQCAGRIKCTTEACRRAQSSAIAELFCLHDLWMRACRGGAEPSLQEARACRGKP